MNWSNEKVIEFLEIFQTEPCLWDPRHRNYKNRGSQNDAWHRIQQLLTFPTTIEELKKKKESLMGYYRIHFNKYKKSLKSGAGKNEIYTTSWFAYETMDSFLREVYENNRSLNTVMNEESMAQEGSETENDRSANSFNIISQIREATQNKEKENGTLNTSQEFSLKTSGRKKQWRDDLPSESRAAQRQMDENFEYMQGSEDDEYERFGSLIAIKIRKIKNPNTRDILMNDIHNLVFRTCMTDRLEQESAAPSFSYNFSPVPNTSQSPHDPLHSTSTCQSPLDSTTSQSPHHQICSPSTDEFTVHPANNSRRSRNEIEAPISRMKVKKFACEIDSKVFST